MKKKFKLFACCIPTKGATRSTIADVQRGNIFFIPNSLFDILEIHQGKELDSIKAYYDNLHDEIIDEYFEYLIVNELGFYCDDPDNFPKIDLSWETPEIFTNAIVDLNKESNYDVCKVLKDIEDVGCKNVEFRIFGGYSQADLKDLCLTFKDSIIRYASILVRYDSSFTNEAVKELLEANQRVQRLVIFNSPEELSFDFVSFVKANIESSNCCGSVNYKYFVSNIELFTESQKYNSCLNKKISVDVNGFIKNCPSMSESFGNVENTSFREVSEIETFKKFWKVNKDQIDVCKVCEFRYVCTDCRAFTLDHSSRYAKPSKCSYNPYTAAWE